MFEIPAMSIPISDIFEITFQQRAILRETFKFKMGFNRIQNFFKTYSLTFFSKLSVMSVEMR